VPRVVNILLYSLKLHKPFNLKKKIIIGRKDKGDFPALGLMDVDLKIDTGAYTSAIHCHKIALKERDGKQILTFKLLDPSHPQYENKEFSTEDFKEKRVKNSFGSSEKRFVIKTNIRLFGKKYAIQLSLSKRGEMRFPILIGRKFLLGKFMVDPARYNLSYNQKTIKPNNK
jgi:hypothetical protein